MNSKTKLYGDGAIRAYLQQKSCYNWLEFGGATEFPYKQIWSAHISIKIKL
jgi:hypothetical protein